MKRGPQLIWDDGFGTSVPNAEFGDTVDGGKEEGQVTTPAPNKPTGTNNTSGNGKNQGQLRTTFSDSELFAIRDMQMLENRVRSRQAAPVLTQNCFIRLSRDFRDMIALMPGSAFKLFFYLLLMSAYREHLYRNTPLKQGQFKMSDSGLARFCHLHRDAVTAAKMWLRQQNLISVDDCTNIITVIDYQKLAMAATDFVAVPRRWIVTELWLNGKERGSESGMTASILKVAVVALMNASAVDVIGNSVADSVEVGKFRVGNNTMCRYCGINESTLTEAYRVLEDIGFLDPVIHVRGSHMPPLISVTGCRTGKWTHDDVLDPDQKKQADLGKANGEGLP